MNETNLQEILEEYAIAAPTGNDHDVLRYLAEKHPQFARDLHNFAAARAVVKYAPEAEISSADELKHTAAGLKNLREISSVKSNSAVLQSLTETAKLKGLSKSKFAAAAGLSVSLVMYLEKRRIDYATIPRKIISKVAEILQTGEEVVADYLKQSPEFAGTNFKSETRPEQIKPKNFTEAVREDQRLSSEQRQKLLNLTAP